jgi:hypothetical protein
MEICHGVRCEIQHQPVARPSAGNEDRAPANRTPYPLDACRTR